MIDRVTQPPDGWSVERFLRARAQIEEGRFVPELFGDVLIAAVTIAVGAGRLPGAVAVRDRHRGRDAQAWGSSAAAGGSHLI